MEKIMFGQMKIVFLYLSLVACFSNLSASDWGYPPYIWITGLSINDYSQWPPGDVSNLTRMHNHRNTFMDQMLTGVYNNSPSTNINDNGRFSDGLPNAVSFQRLAYDSLLDSSEMIFIAAHGDYTEGGLLTYYNNEYFQHSNRSWSGYTKWVFYDSCQQIRYSPSNAAPAFADGLHAIFGHHSILWEFRIWKWTLFPFGYWVASEDHLHLFAYDWTANNKPMQVAWYNGIEHFIVNEGGLGMASGSYQRRGWIGNKYFNGNYQTINNTYKHSFPVNQPNDGIWRNYKTWGNPSY